MVRVHGPHVTVEYLADRREFIPTVARWLHADWGHLRPGETVEDRAARVERDCGHCEVPTTFVALAGDQLVGSASLVDHDMGHSTGAFSVAFRCLRRTGASQARGRSGPGGASRSGGERPSLAASLSLHAWFRRFVS